jgi:hypothetical protein
MTTNIRKVYSTRIKKSTTKVQTPPGITNPMHYPFSIGNLTGITESIILNLEALQWPMKKKERERKMMTESRLL